MSGILIPIAVREEPVENVEKNYLAVPNFPICSGHFCHPSLCPVPEWTSSLLPQIVTIIALLSDGDNLTLICAILSEKLLFFRPRYQFPTDFANAAILTISKVKFWKKNLNESHMAGNLISLAVTDKTGCTFIAAAQNRILF